ncbi:MAG: DUF6515 family protein [Pseudomonadota bacterium]
MSHLPPGHSRVRVRDRNENFFFWAGLFYSRNLWGFVTVRAPLGAVVLSLPIGCRTIRVSRETWYCYEDVYYRKVPAGYEVVEAPPRVLEVENVPPAHAPPYQPGDLVWVDPASLNVRTGPGTEFGIVAVVARWESLEVKGMSPGWLYVRLPSGRMGWVMEEYVAPKELASRG